MNLSPFRAKPVGAVRTKSVTARTIVIGHNTMILLVGWVKGCLQFRPPSSVGRSPQRAGSVRRVCGGVADTHAGI